MIWLRRWSLSAIPSPSRTGLQFGPFELRAYGLMIALGVVAAVALAQRRAVRRGFAPGEVSAVAVWAVPAGLAGARLYHVVTDWRRFEGQWLEAFAVWKGGLGIPGGIAVGVLVGVVVARRRSLPVGSLLDVVAPAIPLAQAIGRLGNWFNQELYGRPTDLPWGLRIDPPHRPPGLADVALYHPTFLYEGLWNLGLMTILLLADRRSTRRPGQLFAWYVAGYGCGRLWVEALRIDPASQILGLRVNVWISGLTLIAALVVLGVRRCAPRDHTVDPLPPSLGSR